MVVYSIKDLEKLTGVKAHTLRIWEKRYNILKPHRTPTNVRYYLDEDLKRILNIALLNRHGIKISKIAKMEQSQIQKKVAEITDVDESFEGQLDSLTISLIELDEDKFLKVLNKNIEQRGFQETMIEMVYPLLDKLAMMWMTGSIKSIHEKFVSHLIRRKCISEIDALEGDGEKVFLIFLPPGEQNELSLLFLHYLIRDYGFKVINAGMNVDIDDLVDINDIRIPDFVFTIVNESMNQEQFRKYVSKMCLNFPQSQIIVSGLQAFNTSFEDEDLLVINSSQETVDFLQSI